MHAVVDESRVPAHRYATAGGAEVGFGGDGILMLAKIVPHVRECLDQRDAEIGGMALLPLRHRHRHPIEHQLTEARVVLGEVVDLRNRALRLATCWRRLAIEIGRREL